jgi:hypothetical protein
VDDLVLMHVVKGSTDLTDDVPGHVLWDSSPLLEVAIKLT